MIKKLLVANRGEIACRIFKTAKKMGISTVAVYSEADADSLHVALADEAILIGPAPSAQSYLNIQNIIDAAKRVNADAVHPGYGFLSENADFAAACKDAGLIFIGPSAASISAMGSKSEAKRIMAEAGVPLVPGYHEKDQRLEVLQAAAKQIGYPVLLKAVAGGGGRGMRPVLQAEDFAGCLTEAKREALASFGNDVMLLEKYLPSARHVEVQVFCDSLGQGVYLFDRDCSLQRRHQKVVEEAPAPNLTDKCRRQMGEAAVRAAQAIDYCGAGTVEFLVEEGSDHSGGIEHFYFMEMNTRLQVEHPVTEAITGLDLVEWQLRVAVGEPLPLQQNELKLNGHAIEVRIYAEDPYAGFRPSTGQLQHVVFPPESEYVRVDTGFQHGSVVSPYYDAMLAKLISWGEDRDTAINHLQNALTQTEIAGVKTNVDWLKKVIDHSAFRNVQIDTQFFSHFPSLVEKPKSVDPHVVVLCWFFCCAHTVSIREQNSEPQKVSPWQALHHWRLNEASTIRAELSIDEHIVSLSAPAVIQYDTIKTQCDYDDQSYVLEGYWKGGHLHVVINGRKLILSVISLDTHRYTMLPCIGAGFFEHVDFTLLPPDHGEAEDEQLSQHCVAPMNARITAIMVEEGESVTKGTALMVLEAMKMEYTITAPKDATIEKIHFTEGALVEGGAELIAFTSEN